MRGSHRAISGILSDAGLKQALPPPLAEARAGGLAYDSRRVQPGDLFFAFPGARADGRQFARQAVEKGALAAVSELPAPDGFAGPWIEVAHGRKALAQACRRFYGAPESSLKLVGITGTNGKTTISYLVDALLRGTGAVTGLVGTIEYRVGPEVAPAVNTTPESLDLYELLERLKGLGGTHATMEVSSHALALARVYGVRFEVAVFSNFTRDHLDFHGTMESYFSAKRLLFEGSGAPPPAWSVINIDDEHGRRIQPGGARISYGLGEGAEVRATGIQSGFDGLRFQVESPRGRFAVESRMVGRINVYNILAACATGIALEIPAERIAAGIRQCGAVPGRFERVDEGQPFLVVVDYAHTDDALRNTIQVARALGPKRIVTLFGCGGDRDRTKRPLMGKAAAELSDLVVLTSDNPRSEDPLAILNDALVGVGRTDTSHVMEPDRATAIRLAISQARPGDIVILAGKGHETYQILNDRTIAFDDREVARQVLRAAGYGRASR